MYVDFNGKRYEWVWTKEMLARFITAGIVVVGVLVWVLWPRERVVGVQPQVSRPAQSDYEKTKRNCAVGYYFDERGWCTPVADTRCVADYYYQDGNCYPTDKGIREGKPKLIYHCPSGTQWDGQGCN
jgi:hypothetical protein